MADIQSWSDRYVYLRVKVPRESFVAYQRKFGGRGFALREIRVQWQRALAVLDRSLPDQADGSALASRPDHAAAAPGS